MRRAADGWWRATWTPDGPATLHLRARAGAVDAEAWGRGAAHVLDGAPGLVGLLDRPEGPDGGRIVTVGSRGAFRGEPQAMAYGASKAAVHSLTQSLALALGGHGIGVSAVAPGFVATDMATSLLAGPVGEAIRAQSPFGRVATPEEVAAVEDSYTGRFLRTIVEPAAGRPKRARKSPSRRKVATAA